MLNSCVSIGSNKKSSYDSPLKKDNHPALDDETFLGTNRTQQCQSLIGVLKSAVSLDRIYSTAATIATSSFRVEPRLGYTVRIKRIYGYLCAREHS